MARRQKRWPTKPDRLPPREYWLFDPEKDKPLPTPVDSNGLVDRKALITLVKSTVDSEHSWENSGEPDRHHLYWAHSKYPNEPERHINPREFCDLPYNRVLIPRMFHSWLHLTTDQPPVPSEEVMHYSIEAQRAAAALFSSARQSIRLSRVKKISERKLEHLQERHLDRFATRLEEARTIPEEFHFVDLSQEISTINDMHLFITKLGECATRGTVSHVRDVMNPSLPIMSP